MVLRCRSWAMPGTEPSPLLLPTAIAGGMRLPLALPTVAEAFALEVLAALSRRASIMRGSIIPGNWTGQPQVPRACIQRCSSSRMSTQRPCMTRAQPAQNVPCSCGRIAGCWQLGLVNWPVVIGHGRRTGRPVCPHVYARNSTKHILWLFLFFVFLSASVVLLSDA